MTDARALFNQIIQQMMAQQSMAQNSQHTFFYPNLQQAQPASILPATDLIQVDGVWMTPEEAQARRPRLSWTEGKW